MKDELWRRTLEYDYARLSPGDWDELREHDPDSSFMWHTPGSTWDRIRAQRSLWSVNGVLS